MKFSKQIISHKKMTKFCAETLTNVFLNEKNGFKKDQIFRNFHSVNVFRFIFIIK